MIEIIYKESEEKGDAVFVKPPKNIRQIGMPRGRHKIYVEDYVYTFLHSAAFEGECPKRAAVLLGKSEVAQDIRYTFINGAVSCDELIFREDDILFDENCWEYIYEEIKRCFDGQEIIGWFLGVTGFPPDLTPMVEAAHRKYFAGRDKVLFLSEPAEREDIFYAYEQGVLLRKEGYYIYYEKNLAMQEYMVSARERVGDRKRKEQEKKEQERFAMNLNYEKDEGQGIFTLDSEREEGKDQGKLTLDSECEEGKGQGKFTLDSKREEGKGQGKFTLDSDRKKSVVQRKPILGQPEGSEQTEFATEQQEKTKKERLGQLTENSAASMRETGERISAEEALQNYRNMLLERKQEVPSRKMSTFLYIAASAAMVILCVIGIATMNNYEEMKQLKETIAVFANFGGKGGDGDSQAGVRVENVPGQVTPQEQQSGNTGDTTDQSSGSTGGSTGQSSGSAGSSTGRTTGNAGNSTGQTSGSAESQQSGTTAGQPSSSQQPREASSQQPGGTDTTSMAGQTTETAALAKTYLDQGYYIVQPGDKLELICKKIYQTTAMMDKLCEVNQLDDVDKIYAGQKLILP